MNNELMEFTLELQFGILISPDVGFLYLIRNIIR